MQKKIIAVAIMAAISAPAFADNANVTLYGKAFLNGEFVTNDKATKTSGQRVQNDASRFGIKGSEDLGDGLSAIYQFEVAMDSNGNAGNGLGNGTRNSGVGLKSATLGQVIFGNWDTPFKVAHNKIELFDNTTSFSSMNLIGEAGGTKKYDYVTRQKNAVIYTSPAMSGITFAASASEDATQAAPGAMGTKFRLSSSLTYDAGDVYVAGAYENRKNETVAGTSDNGTRLVGRYHLGDAWIGATVESFTINTSASKSFTQSNVELAGQYKMGASTFAASYAQAGATDVADTGANQISVRYGYNFSKRTELFAAYTALTNQKAGVYGFWGTNAGSAQTALGTGLIHSF